MFLNKKIFTRALIFLTLLLVNFQLNSKGLSSPILKILADTYDNYQVDISSSQESQTITHLKHCISKNFINNYDLKERIKEIGKENIENIINQVLEKEIELKNNYFVLYHGQKREFLLFHDLLNFFEQIKKKLNFKDFLFLRIPEKNLYTYQDAESFLKINNYNINDSVNPQRKLLLSVNPSLFSNSSNGNGSGSSTFGYFLQSASCFYISNISLIEDIFNNFNLQNLFQKYQQDLSNLINLLATHEQEKTGLLIQIFIPKNFANEILYKSQALGYPFYLKYDYQNNPEYLQETTPEQDLENYQKDSLANLTLTDETQFRILFTQNLMLNPNSGIKIFRYYNETENSKKYKELLKNLKKQIIQNLNYN